MQSTCNDRSCPVCGCAETLQLLRQCWLLFEDHPLKIAGNTNGRSEGESVFGIDSCCSCGAVFNSPIPRLESYDLYYSQWSRYADGTDSLNTAVLGSQVDRFENTLSIVTPFIKSTNSRILDVGCLDGGLPQHFLRKGFKNVMGVDPSPNSSRQGERGGVAIRVGTATQLPFSEDEPFDFVTCIHALEHVADLRAIQLARLLAPGGRLYVEVPDASAYNAKVGRDVFADFSLEHVNHFGQVSLSNVFKQFGMHQLVAGRRKYEVRSSGNAIQDSIYCIFEKGHDETAVVTEIDTETSTAVRCYIDEAALVLRRQADAFRRIVQKFGGVRVLGTGHAAFRLLGQVPDLHSSILGVGDNNPLYWKKRLANNMVVSSRHLVEAGSGPIYITSAIHADEMTRQLRETLGFTGPIFSPRDEFNA